MYLLQAGLYDLKQPRFDSGTNFNLSNFYFKSVFMNFNASIIRPVVLRLLGLAGCLALLSVSCSKSDGGDPDPVLNVSPRSLTFDAADAAKNRVTVESNGTWNVTPDAGLAVDKRSGNGNGTFTVTDAPAGKSSTLTVTMGALSQTVIVVRDAEPVVPSLEVAPETLEFKPGGAGNTVEVTCNTAWTASASNGALKFTPASGEGNGTITVTDMAEGETYTLTVTAGEGADAVGRTVSVTRKAAVDPVTVLFSLDFGAAPAQATFTDAFESWKTQTGTGAAGVTYDALGVKIRGSYDGASAGASGKGYATMTATKTTNHFTVRNIALPADAKDFTLSFYAIFPADDVILSVSDGSAARELAYQGSPAYNTWKKVTVGFSLKEPVSQLTLSLAPKKAFTFEERQYGLNFDDIVLMTGGGGQQIDFTPASYRWAELPSDFETPATDQFVHTTWTTTVTSGKHVRNYTYCYDTRRHNPVWVAYPHHSCYLEGSGRSDEPWAADPALPESQQSKIYGTSPDDKFQYWTADLVTGRYGEGYWSRGHLCMSRERSGKGLEINVQTFRPTNIAPQPSEPSPFGKIWGNVETVISGGAIPVDTLYIVAGCYYENDNQVEKDASNFGVLSSLSKACVMPTHQFKMAVRKKTAQVGKPIQECTAAELQTIAFWVETLTRSSATELSELGEFIVPVSFVEEKMQVKFFPGIPDAAKTSKGTLAEWGY